MISKRDIVVTGAMPSITSRHVWVGSVMAVLLIAAAFAWEGHTGLSLWDEGYLWYGIQRVMLGEVLLRDFQSYDPGRYYWSAALMTLAGAHGIIAVRVTVALLQAAALASALAALSVLVRGKGRLIYLTLSAFVLVAWMVPRHKVFDISISIGLVCVIAAWIHKATAGRALLAGIYLGIAAWFGRNHGIYGALACAGGFAYLALRCDDARVWWRSLATFSLGVVIGYSPMLVMLAFAKGFASALLESIRFIFEVKSTNLPLPIPWPWHARFGQVPIRYALGDLVAGLFFVGLIVFAVGAICHVFYSRSRGRPIKPLFVAAALAGVPYAHYAFSRADVGHLAQGVFPLLIGLLALFSTWRPVPRLVAGGALLLVSVFAAAPLHPGWQCRELDCQQMDIDGDLVKVEPQAAHDVRLLQHLSADFASHGEDFYVTPLLPGAYALLGRRSPTWENYTAWPRSEAFQREEIARLQSAHPAFVVVYDLALDGRDELRFRNTHPLVDSYISRNYTRVNGYTDNPAFQVYRP